MAIIGTLSTLMNQCNNERIKTAINYLLKTNISSVFTTVSAGTPFEVEIDGRRIFAIFQTYETKPIAEAKMEGHQKYIDIQYIHKGTEQILIAPINRIVKDDPYDATKDLYFPKVADYSNIRLATGSGCILYPDDLHAPCISIDAPTKVEKIVIKVAVD
ncbi:YhcH/YjgK/YiaL family protein [Carboxylicivirga mesophila]|uniref:YhcH/YjgK/YiaL family protein n=2 Tax=Carboxylicivirga TaxID=1628153 RepID=A0A941IWU8_9BACT|nr:MULTISPECIES: YhcH/YjgK/YiaL family protein [Carboxylicivirga]MBR8533952.1 YhcH/YjgK/YiaL family protein [Carboxylicivirga sediminis]MBS2211887.1 YhcH/YjgK/YiaL family protein [Carboxylicivirga mesophila]